MKVVKDSLIAAIGGFSCILLLSYLDNFENIYIWLIPSFGASMVLVMSVHKSDLAQPKNIFFGHVISGLSGYFVLSFIGSNIFCIGLGVGLAIFLMMITKTVHPPAGGNPIIVILGEQSFSFIYITLTLGSLIIIIFAIVYNKIVGKNYPYRIKKDFN